MEVRARASARLLGIARLSAVVAGACTIYTVRKRVDHLRVANQTHISDGRKSSTLPPNRGSGQRHRAQWC
ncbi:MAG: hypothetical protein QOI29_3038 [Mycobacterium sp.]|nr:hypothetical protein [Mycobacterium sp.]